MIALFKMEANLPNDPTRDIIPRIKTENKISKSKKCRLLTSDHNDLQGTKCQFFP
jgi:hypothetical protein